MREAERRGAGRSGWVAVGVLLGSSWLGDARAAAPEWLGWSAPAECQNTLEVERRLESLLGHPVERAQLPPTRVRMGWSPERGWSVRVTVGLAGGPRERALDAPSCADAFDVVALSLALILDPSFAGGGADGAEPPPGAGASGEEATLEGAGRGEADVTGADEVAGEGGPSAALVAGNSGSVDAAASGADAPARSARGASSGASPELSLVVGGGALTDARVFPVPQFGGGVQAGLVAGRVRLELGADLLASESTIFAGAQYPVSFYTLTSALRGCYTAPLSERLGWVACVAGELGQLGTRERGGASRSTDGLWLAAEAATGPEFAATPWLRAFARARAVSPLLRHDLVLSEGTRVHTLPWISPQLQVGISVTLTDFGGAAH